MEFIVKVKKNVCETQTRAGDMKDDQRAAASIMTGTHNLGWVYYSQSVSAPTSTHQHPQKQGPMCDFSLMHSSVQREVMEHRTGP